MANKKINLCCTLLSVILCAAFLSIGTTESYARYEDTFSFRTVLVPKEKNTVQSDLIVMSTDAQQIVLVGELSSAEETKTVSFSLTAGGNSETGTFSLINNNTNYINVSASTDSGALEHGAELAVPAETTKTVTLTFTADATAFNIPHDELDIDVDITWGEMEGIFRVTIPEVKGQDSESGGGTVGETADESQNMELDSPAEQEAPSEQQTAAEEIPEKETAENGIMSIGKFDIFGLLPVKVNLKDGVTKADFGLYDSNKPKPVSFPAKTRFSLDGGESFFVLPEENIVEIEKNELNGGILFDFSKTNLTESESISIAMQPWNSGVSEELCHLTVSTGAQNSFRTAEYSGEALLETSGDENGTEIGSEGWKICTLDGSNSIEFFFPAEWAEAELSATVQILALGGNGTVYNSAEGIITENKINEETGVRSLRIGTDGTFPQAGTYRIYLVWKYKDIAFMKTEIPFFINYSTPFGNVPDSQEVPYGN